MKKILLIIGCSILFISCSFTKNLSNNNANNSWTIKDNVSTWITINTWIIDNNTNSWVIENITNTWYSIWSWDILINESQEEDITWLSLSWTDKETEEIIEEINEILKWL